MFGFSPRKRNGRPKNVRARDGLVRQTSAQRRSRRKHSGLSGKQHRIITKERRAYKSGKRTYRKRTF